MGTMPEIFLPFCDLSLLCVLQIDVFVPSFCEFIKYSSIVGTSISVLNQGVGGVMAGLGLFFFFFFFFLIFFISCNSPSAPVSACRTL